MSFNPLDLGGKRILVTGASSGIGRAVAVMLDRLGAELCLSGRRAEALAETREALDPSRAHRVVPFDLTAVDDVPGWLRQVTDGGARLDGLVHAAGVGGLTPLRIQARRHLDGVLVPNLYATLALLRGASAKAVTNDGASLVFLSSVASLAGAAGLTAYSASKGGVDAAVRAAAVELKDRRLRVNSVAPAYVRTPMMEESQRQLPDFQAIEARQFLGFLEPDEVAVAVAYLLSDPARRVTGTTLVVDAGFTC